MSFVVTVYVPEAIVMASDSRQTVTLKNQAETVNSDFAYKTFLLPRQQVGLSTFGQAALGGVSVQSQVARAEVSRKNINGQTGELTYGASWGGQADVITRLLKAKQVVGAEGQLQEISAARVNWHLLNVQDAIDFAIYAVRTTIDTMRFEARPKNAGGPIDVLLLTPAGARWIQRKELHGEPPARPGRG